MTNVQAAICVAQMELLDTFVERKNNNYAYYKELLDNNSSVKLMPFREGTYSNKWFYALNVMKKDVDMHELVNKLTEKGVQTRLIWGLIHEQKPYENAISYRIEKAVEYSRCILNVPCSTNISGKDICEVCDKISEVLS